MVWLVLAGLFAAAGNGPVRASEEPIVRIVHLAADDGDRAAMEALAADFAERNPGYAVEYSPGGREVVAADRPRVVFVQAGEARGRVVGRGSGGESGGAAASDLWVGDIVLLRPGERLECEGGLGLLTFTTPERLPDDLPSFVRPDWDEHITDTPGGCATETGAYRRVCLTWLREKGRYNYHALNAHRVRIMDSFTHYHPVEGGFDEFYLVQMVQPGAEIIVSDRVAAIEDPGSVGREEAAGLLHAYPLAVGDLVYLPRGVAHRGFGGVLAQVITAPGFVPGAEIGVDHHLRAINERLGLRGGEALPYNVEASAVPVVR